MNEATTEARMPRSSRHCCQGASPARSFPPARDDRSSPLARAIEFLKWLAPGALLALLPKCPVCVAGYVAVATGIGISLPAAGHLRTALALACVASLAFLLATRGRRALARLAARRLDFSPAPAGKIEAPRPPRERA